MRRRRQVSAARRPLADGGERRAAARAACGVTGRARGPGRALDGRGRGALQGVGSPCPPTARGRVEHTWRPAHPGCQRLKVEVRLPKCGKSARPRPGRPATAGRSGQEPPPTTAASAARAGGPGGSAGSGHAPRAVEAGAPGWCAARRRLSPARCLGAPPCAPAASVPSPAPPGQAPSRARAPSPQKPLDEGAGVLGRAPGTSCSRGLPGSRPQDPADRAPRSTSTWASGAADPQTRTGPAPPRSSPRLPSSARPAPAWAGQWRPTASGLARALTHGSPGNWASGDCTRRRRLLREKLRENQAGARLCGPGAHSLLLTKPTRFGRERN